MSKEFIGRTHSMTLSGGENVNIFLSSTVDIFIGSLIKSFVLLCLNFWGV